MGVRPQNLVVVVGLLDLLTVPDLFREEVLRRLDPTTLALVRRVNRAFRAAVESSSDLPRAGVSAEVPLQVDPFVQSVKLLAWAKANGCPWVAGTCSCAAEYGKLEVVQWAREHDCPWDAMTSSFAAGGGHLDVLRWAREHHCAWDWRTCALAALGGHLEVLKWARANHCPWDNHTCAWPLMEGTSRC